jgi:hypothetical protein
VFAGDPATQLYNLRLDGNHTYFANDLRDGSNNAGQDSASNP